MRRTHRLGSSALLAGLLLAPGGGLRADDFLRVRPGPGAALEHRPRRGQREVLHRKGIFVDMVADAALRRELERRGYRLEVLQEGIDGVLATVARPDAGPYHRHAEMIAEMRAWARRAPELVHLRLAGYGAEPLPGGGRREIPVARFAAPGPEDRPKVLLFGGIHARELATTEVLLMLGRFLVEEVPVDGELRSLLATREVWILPTLNPDGREFCFREDPWWRKNRAGAGGAGGRRGAAIGVDLNRNFSFRWGRNPPRGGSSGLPASGIYRGPHAFSEPESRALRDLVREQGFAASLSLHSYGRMILVPFGYDRREPSHRALYAELVDRLVESTGYEAGSVQEVLGYYSNGRHDDWLYADADEGKGTVAAAELEIGRSFFPSWPEVQRIAGRIREAALEVVRLAGADLRLAAEVRPRVGRDLALQVDVENRGIREARDVLVRVDRIPEGVEPLMIEELGEVPGLGDPRLDAPVTRRLHLPLDRGPRALRITVSTPGEASVIEEMLVPAVD